VNFANCDMVGHTGIYESAVKAVEVTDESVRTLVDAATAKDYVVMISSDHGNAEEMWDYRINMPKTAHTTNPVEFIYIDKDRPKARLRPHGILSDIAPTVLEVMDLDQPEDMTSESLLAD
ncbi:MAG TPA: 2,3-bisphosphoglycerate-independent phosphoglycerate mutase, partial [Elusimicrobiales bacterium]|nr:2,3-bisphosphoglycerate-independent phosphoglycerate mutase [Elusimicrobiales bacterium]